MKFKTFLKLISKIENIPLPAESSHFKMIPPRRKSFQEYSANQLESAKKAGVLALFYPNKKNETTLVFILRKTYKGVHSAQVSFPGGKKEKEDKTLADTAVRETFEEIGVPIQDIKIIKNLTEVYIPPSNFYVQSFVGITNQNPVFYKQDREVEQIIEVNLADVVDDNNIQLKTLSTPYGTDIEVPAFKLSGFVIWGATAMILSEIKDILKQLA